MIWRKFRSIKNEKLYPTWPYSQGEILIFWRKDLCKSFTMLSFTLPKEALDVTKRDMQKQNRSS